MKIKVIGIGNRIMKDDSIGVRVVEELEQELTKLGIETIIGETDIEYTLNCIDNGDYILVIDSSLLGKSPGEISTFDIKELQDFNHKGYSMHQMSLIKILSCFSYPKIEGSLITIEASQIDFGLDLSEELRDEFQRIKEEVLKVIRSKVTGEI